MSMRVLPSICGAKQPADSTKSRIAHLYAGKREYGFNFDIVPNREFSKSKCITAGLRTPTAHARISQTITMIQKSTRFVPEFGFWRALIPSSPEEAAILSAERKG